MKKNGRLVCWIGNNDLLSMAADADERTQKQVFEALDMDPKPLRKDTGPIRTLLENETFEDVHFLCNKPAVISRKYVKWLGKKATVHTVDLQDPTDYAGIFAVVDATLSALPTSRASLNILLSPGTPAMTAIWVLLGKSRYPATFFQSYNGKSWQSEIPYDLISDYLPELLRDPDSNLARLTQLQLAAMSRAEIAESDRTDFFAYVDEFQNFATESFATILSEARKYRLSLTIANQYLAQMDEQTADAVFGNVGSMLIFQVGARDAETLAEQLGGDLEPQDLMTLPRYTAYMRLLIDGMPSRPFSMTTLPPAELTADTRRPAVIRRTSRHRYCRPAEQVEKEMAETFAIA